jgi:hypothetical protein
MVVFFVFRGKVFMIFNKMFLVFCLSFFISFENNFCITTEELKRLVIEVENGKKIDEALKIFAENILDEFFVKLEKDSDYYICYFPNRQRALYLFKFIFNWFDKNSRKKDLFECLVELFGYINDIDIFLELRRELKKFKNRESVYYLEGGQKLVDNFLLNCFDRLGELKLLKHLDKLDSCSINKIIFNID